MPCFAMILAVAIMVLGDAAASAEPAPDVRRCSMWRDPYRGEPVPYEAPAPRLRCLQVQSSDPSPSTVVMPN